jgi:hypothetical protein
MQCETRSAVECIRSPLEIVGHHRNDRDVFPDCGHHLGDAGNPGTNLMPAAGNRSRASIYADPAMMLG